jgi:hypothetical protein
LLAAVAWRKSHQRPVDMAVEPSPSTTYVPATIDTLPVLPPPPPPVEVAAPIPTPDPMPVETAVPPPGPIATAEPAPAPEPAPATSPIVTAAARPVAKKPKKALYDTP